MKTKCFIYILIHFLVSILFFSSCDILRFDLFEVASWSPGDGFHAEPENITVSLNFTLEPDRGSVERNFSLTGNGNSVRGTFLWNGKRMTFIPLAPLEANTDYNINLSADAHDTKGLSMDDAFNRDFTTRPGNARPVLLSFYPQMYEAINDTRTEIQLSFSIPVPLNTLYSSISFSPSMTGSWRLENNDTKGTNSTLAIFTPTEPWTLQTRYEIKFSTSLIDINGMNIGNDFLSTFFIGTDNEAPYLLSAQRITKNGEYIDLNTENEGWEKEDKLFLVFSKPVDWITVRNNLSVVAETAQDAPSLVLESETGAEFIFKFDTIPTFESRFKIYLKPGVKDFAGNTSKDEYNFKIFANGQYSRPPELIGFRMPMSPQSETDLQFFSAGKESIFEIIPISDEYYPSSVNVPTWIELYFDTVADIDLFSVMELFNIDSLSSAIKFSPRLVKNNNFSVIEPQAGWEEYQRIEITGILTNSIQLGLIYIRIGAGLSDSLGNKNEKPQMITVQK